MKSFNDPEPKIRKAAATAAGKLRLEEALSGLMELSRDDNWPVRMEAVIALNHLKAEESFSCLCERLQDPRPEVRRVAALAVGNTRRSEAAEPLLPLLDQSQTPAVRRAAISALAGIGGDGLVDRLGPALSDPDEGVRIETAKAVLRLVERN